MTRVVRFENTKRRLDWMDEQQLRDGKKRDKQRRDERRTNRNVEWGEEE